MYVSCVIPGTWCIGTHNSEGSLQTVIPPRLTQHHRKPRPFPTKDRRTSLRVQLATNIVLILGEIEAAKASTKGAQQVQPTE